MYTVYKLFQAMELCIISLLLALLYTKEDMYL